MVQVGRQSEVERKLNYQTNFRRGELPAAEPVLHYSVHLHRPLTPGVAGAPSARLNFAGMTEDWQASLSEMHTTAHLLHAKCEWELQQAQQHVVAGDTVALRRAVNASLLTQMEHFTSSMAAWACMPPRAAQPQQLAGQ